MLRIVLIGASLAFSTMAQAQPTTMSREMHHGHSAAVPSQSPGEGGQSAFAAIQEIVSILVADPATDWSTVNIEALRRHLIDMDNVTLRSDVKAAPVDNGIRFTVTGAGPVRDSIARMVKAHAATVDGTNGMTIKAADHPEGAVMTVTVASEEDLVKLRGLGFIGVMTLGMHHQAHHLGIATGHPPHH